MSNDERQAWKYRAKQFNESAAGRAQLQQRRQRRRDRGNHSPTPSFVREPMTNARDRLNESPVLHASRRTDEEDEYSTVYFEPGCDEFIWKRMCDVRNMLAQFTERFDMNQQQYNDGREFTNKEDYFLRRRLCVASVNVHYCDANHNVYPSEISLIKFNIADGLLDERNFILSLPRYLVIPREYESAIVNNEERTMLRADQRDHALCHFMRSDFDEIWHEIKEFTNFDGVHERIAVRSGEWNSVVGAFHTLCRLVGEHASSRIGTRFVVIEDYLQAMTTSILQDRQHSLQHPQPQARSHISAQLQPNITAQATAASSSAASRRDVTTVARNDQHASRGTCQSDVVTCSFHHQLLLTNQCRARACAMFTARQTAFNFLTLSKQYAFRNFTITGTHFPDGDNSPEAVGEVADWGAVNSGAECGIRGEMTPHLACRQENVRDGPRVPGTFEEPKRQRQKEQREELWRRNANQRNQAVQDCRGDYNNFVFGQRRSTSTGYSDVSVGLERTTLGEGTRETHFGGEVPEIGYSRNASRSPDTYIPEENVVTYVDAGTWWRGRRVLRNAWNWNEQRRGEPIITSTISRDKRKKRQEKASNNVCGDMQSLKFTRNTGKLEDLNNDFSELQKSHGQVLYLSLYSLS
ncbi:unnamed protein product [Anisakis simplex]|uniref:ATP-dependent DNA helicase n=1 Tax=Anisakis simplex TaxID=6269 RepID=A0A0M3K3S7_ANISI|nr:unnamed protein product [Anisakis simplex]